MLAGIWVEIVKHTFSLDNFKICECVTKEENNSSSSLHREFTLNKSLSTQGLKLCYSFSSKMYSFREWAPQNRPKQRHLERVGCHLYFGNDDITFDKLSSILCTKELSMVHCVAVGRHTPNGWVFINYPLAYGGRNCSRVIFFATIRISYIEQAIAILTIHLHMHQQTWESTVFN